MQPKDNQLTFRNLAGEQDYPLLLEINCSSREADGNPEPITLQEIASVLAQMDGLTPQEGVIIALAGDTPIGYSRLGWYSSQPENRLYYQISFLRAEQRSSGYWAVMVAENERRLREIDAWQTPVAERYFQAWTSEHQKDWETVLEQMSYQVVRRFNNMLFHLGNPPSIPLPAGFEIRPVLPEHIREVWEARKEMNAGLFENVTEDWLDEKYPAWLANPENNPGFWQVAWEGDRLAGMVLAHVDEGENKKTHNKHGYTEHITCGHSGAGAVLQAP